MKKAMSILIVVACLFSIAVLTTDGSDAAYTNALYVDGTLVSGDTDNSEWSYVSATNTLTLKDGANLDNYWTDEDDYKSPIYDGRGGTLKIVIAGAVSITGALGGDYKDFGIFSTESVEISGTGTLTVNNAGFEYGICAISSLTINGGTININGVRPGSFDVMVSPWGPGGNFTMAGGTLNLNSTGDLDCNGAITVSGGTIVTIGTGNIMASAGNFTISGGIVKTESAVADSALIGTSGDFSIAGGESALRNVVADTSYIGNIYKCVASGQIASIGIAPTTYTVTFDPQGGTVTPTTKETGNDGKLASLPDATRDGYTFDGWFTAASGGDKITTSTVFTENKTVYAHWTENTPVDPGEDKKDNTPLFVGIGVGIAAVVLIGVGAFFFIKKR